MLMVLIFDIYMKPNLLHGMLSMRLLCGSHNAGEGPLYLRLRMGFAAVLQESLFSHGAYYPVDPDSDDRNTPGDAVDGDDERAGLVLQLLLDSLDAPAPNLAHILMGFDVASGPEGEETHVGSHIPQRSPLLCLSIWGPSMPC
jgi:hypothetical protein